MRMSEDRLSVAVAVGLAAVVLLVLAGPALGSAAREYLRHSVEPADTPCALSVGPAHAYCFSTTAPTGSSR
jgi:hypothetical protein